MALSRLANFQAQDIAHVPHEPGVYVLIGSRGIVNYVGESDRDLHAELREMLTTGRVPASKFRYAVILNARSRSEKKLELLDEHTPRYNAA